MLALQRDRDREPLAFTLRPMFTLVIVQDAADWTECWAEAAFHMLPPFPDDAPAPALSTVRTGKGIGGGAYSIASTSFFSNAGSDSRGKSSGGK